MDFTHSNSVQQHQQSNKNSSRKALQAFAYINFSTWCTKKGIVMLFSVMLFSVMSRAHCRIRRFDVLMTFSTYFLETVFGLIWVARVLKGSALFNSWFRSAAFTLLHIVCLHNDKVYIAVWKPQSMDQLNLIMCVCVRERDRGFTYFKYRTNYLLVVHSFESVYVFIFRNVSVQFIELCRRFQYVISIHMFVCGNNNHNTSIKCQWNVQFIVNFPLK